MNPRSPRLSRIGLGVLAAAALALPAMASGATLTGTIGAPDAQMGAAPTALQGPTTWAQTATTASGWNFTVPRKGIVTATRLYVMSSPVSGSNIRVVAVDTTTQKSTAMSDLLPLPSPNGPAGTQSVSPGIPVQPGQALGISLPNNSLQAGTSYDGGSGEAHLASPGNASPTPGTQFTLSTGGTKVLQAQYDIAYAPANTVAPVAGGVTPVEGVALTASPGTWDSSPTSYAYQWLRCDALGTSCTAISGATAQDYTPVTADVGSTLRVRVTASNVEGGAGDPVDSPASQDVQGAASVPTGLDGVPAVTQYFAPATAPQPKVTLCHATASATNPYVVITVAPEAVIRQGHDQHQDRRDIIPPFEYEKNGQTVSYPGLNWNAVGRAVLAAGCQTPQAPVVNAVLDPPEASKVTICHATGSAGNPYVRITIAPQAIFAAGHDQHQARRDIIPPFAYGGTAYPGLNWDTDGRAVYRNGCAEPAPVLDPATQPAGKVTLCHRVGGPQYVVITVAPQGALNGHAKNHPLDIIPPFTYHQGNKSGSFPGQNWDAAGQAIYRNGCVPPAPVTPQGITDPEPQPIRPAVACVAAAPDGTLTAYFAYVSANTIARSIPLGADNMVAVDALSTGASVGTVPTVFQPGQVDVAVTVTGLRSGGSATWEITYDGVTTVATANASSPRCPAPATAVQEVGVFTACVTPAADGTYSATFGYQNDGTTAVYIPTGDLNQVVLTGVAAGARDRGQPSTFQPGRDGGAFTVTGIPRNAGIAWAVEVASGTHVAVARYDSRRCEGAPQENLPIGVSATCVQSNGDGTYDVVFGYSNPNGVTIEVPSGPGNAVSTAPGTPGPETRGQPVQFMPGTVDRAFAVTGIPVGQQVTWTLAYQGTVTASARPGSAPACRPATDPTPVDPKPIPDPPEIPVAPTTQRVGVFVSCVNAGRRSYSATFGYVNPGVLPVDIAIGSANGVTGGPDRGQPSTFVPGTVAQAFTVTGIPRGSAVTWTVVAPDGVRATATSSPAGAPTCTTGKRPIDPQVIIEVVPPGEDPKPVVDIVNPGPDPIDKPPITVVVPPGVTPPSGTDDVACATRGARTTCTTRGQSLLPGRRLRIPASGAARSTGACIMGVGLPLRGQSGAPSSVNSSSACVLRAARRPAVTG